MTDSSGLFSFVGLPSLLCPFTVLLLHCSTALLLRYITTLLLCSFTAPLHHCITRDSESLISYPYPIIAMPEASLSSPHPLILRSFTYNLDSKLWYYLCSNCKLWYYKHVDCKLVYVSQCAKIGAILTPKRGKMVHVDNFLTPYKSSTYINFSLSRSFARLTSFGFDVAAP
jgi:hypothetical protein